MTQIDYRANLSAAVFPMTVAKASRSVIIPGPDQNFDRRIDPAGGIQPGSVGIPQVIFGQNILPTPQGFQSVGFRPRTAITVGGSSINTVVPVRVATATVTEEVTTGGAVAYTSAGDDLTAWEKSATNTPPNSLSQVIQDPLDGGNPTECFFLDATVNIDDIAGTWPASPWVRKSFAIGNPDNAGFDVDVYFLNNTGQAGQCFRIGLFNNAANAGLQVVLNLFANTFTLGTANDLEGAGFASIDSATPSSAVAISTWYTIEATLTKTVADPDDHTRFVQVLLKDSGGTTIATVDGFYTTALGTYCGILSESGYGEGTAGSGINGGVETPDQRRVDNIEVSGDGEETTETFTEYTGLVTAYIAFLANNTALWSYSLDVWTNYAVIEPGGFESPLNPNRISVANVRGVTYICVRNNDATTNIYIASVNTGTNEITLQDITATIDATLPNGYSIDSVLGICTSYNYLILFTGGTILWSSTTTPTDFAPSLISGAGNEIPGNLKGDITFLREHVSGFFIYSTKNVVFAQYTGNARYPWRFREIGQSGGFDYSTQASGDTNSSVQYGINNSKFIQILNPESAELVAPEVTDFIEKAARWDLYDTNTHTFSLSDPTFSLIPTTKPTAYFVMDRYLLLPYGMSDAATNLQWTFVIVYDVLLKRYGKFKITHDFCLSDERDTYFINRLNGAISRLYFNILEYATGGGAYVHEGVIVLGKFQLTRERFISLDELQIDAVQNIEELADPDDREITVRILPSLNGRSFGSPVTPFDNTDVAENLDGLELLTRVSCQNFAISIVGAFDLNTVAMTCHPEGEN